MKTVSLDGWKLFSSRRNSDNYVSEDEKTLLKVFKLGGEEAIEMLEHERRVSEYIRGLGIKTPGVGDLCRTEDGTVCMTYENIKNKKSISRAVSEDPKLAEPYMELVAEIGKTIHSIDCGEDWIPNYRDMFFDSIDRIAEIPEDRLEDIKKQAQALPFDSKCLHGDFHPGNFIIADGVLYTIDITDFARGCPMYDIGQFFALSQVMPARAHQEVFHWDDGLNACFGNLITIG